MNICNLSRLLYRYAKQILTHQTPLHNFQLPLPHHNPSHNPTHNTRPDHLTLTPKFHGAMNQHHISLPCHWDSLFPLKSLDSVNMP
jgi:hypothetical protein